MKIRSNNVIPSQSKLAHFTTVAHMKSGEIHRAIYDLSQEPVCLQFVDQKKIDKQLPKLERLEQCPIHPSILRSFGTAHNRKQSAIVLQDFVEDIDSFIARRREEKKFFTATEMLFIFRQLIAALAMLENQDANEKTQEKYAHGDIRLNNMVVSRNSQNQLVFRVGYLDTEKSTKSEATHAADIYNMAISICQIMMLDNGDPCKLNVKELRDKLLKGGLHARFKEIPELFEILLHMLDEDPTKRPKSKDIQIALAKVDLNNRSKAIAEALKPSNIYDMVVPAGSGDCIVKAAQQGNAEAQYQLALLLSERGHNAQAYAWAKKAADQNHPYAQFFVGSAYQKGKGCPKDLKQAEIYLNKSTEHNIPVTKVAYKEKGLTKIDLKMSLLDGQSVLTTLSNLIDTTSNITQPSQLKLTDTTKPFLRQLEFEKVLTDVEVKPIPIPGAYMADQVQKYLLLRRLPKHPHLQLIIGYCGYFATEDFSLPNPIATVVPALPSMQDFFNKEETRNKFGELFPPLALQIASALEALHDQNLVHGNISYSNIVVSKDVIHGMPQAILAGYIDHISLCKDSLAEKTYFHKAEDIFAFGLTILEMIVKGKNLSIPLDRTMKIEALMQIVDFTEKSYLSAPKELCSLVRQCLQADPAQRPTAHQIVETLAQITKIEPKRISKSSLVNLENEYKMAINLLADNPKFASILLRDAADAGYVLAQQKLAEMLWEGEVIPENQEEAIHYCELAAKSNPENQARLKWMREEHEKNVLGQTLAQVIERIESLAAKKDQEQLTISKELSAIGRKEHLQTPEDQKQQEQKELEQKELEQKEQEQKEQELKAAENLRLAFQHFFGLDVLRNLELSREFLVKASESKLSTPSTRLARTILKLSSNPLEEKCPLRFFVPGDDFQPPFVELEPTVYRQVGKAFRTSIVGRIGVLVAPTDDKDIESMLSRCAHAHPNVIGPIGITGNVTALSSTGAKKSLPIAWLYAPITALPVDRNMVSDATTATSRLLPFLVGVAEGLAHLHRSHVVHGNVSLNYLSVGHDRLGLIATGPASCKRASAPESLVNNQFSSASDVFQFGQTIALMLTGGTWEDGWLPKVGEIDAKTKLARLSASAASGFADLRAKIPAWCPQPLVDIMLRCLNMDPTKRPTMDAVATEIQTLRNLQIFIPHAEVSQRPAQFWMHTSHICQELTLDDPWLNSTIECLYGPRTRDRMQQNHNPVTHHSKIISGSQKNTRYNLPDSDSLQMNSNISESTRKIIEHKSQFFIPQVLAAWDGSEAPSRGDRHLKGWAHGPKLLDDNRLNANLSQIDNPPKYSFQTVFCTGEPNKCRCHRASRPKNPLILSDLKDHVVIEKMNPHLTQHLASFLEFKDFASLSEATKYTNKICEGNMRYWENIIKEHGNQGQTYVPLKELKATGNFDTVIQRWAKIIATQIQYTNAYTRLQLEPMDVLHIPDITREERKQLIDKAHNDYKMKYCSCGICGKCVPFANFMADVRTRAVGGPFMACQNCHTHNIWTSQEAKFLWGFTPEQLDQIPFWRFSTTKRFCTADLLEFRKKMPVIQSADPDDAIEPRDSEDEIWNRYHDLPGCDKDFFIVEQKPSLDVTQVSSSASTKSGDTACEKNVTPMSRPKFLLFYKPSEVKDSKTINDVCATQKGISTPNP